MTNNIPNIKVDVLLATSKIFGDDDCIDAIRYECEKGFIRFRGNFWFGSSGIEGSLGIGIAPKENPTLQEIKMSQDAWEGSRDLRYWDWWKCLGITIIPPAEGNSWESGFDVVIFIEHNTFFDNPLKRVKTIKIRDDSHKFAWQLCNFIYTFDDFEKCKEHKLEDEIIESDCCSFSALKYFLRTEFDARFIEFEIANTI
jgi:hypothetical protein